MCVQRSAPPRCMAVRQGARDHREVCVRDGLVILLGNLKQHALRTAPGQKIAYAVDLAYNERNIEKVVALAQPAFSLRPRSSTRTPTSPQKDGI